jgi:hypothetical protein
MKKKTETRFMMLLAVGILVMNTGVVVDYFVDIDNAIIDFFKGVGIALVLTSLFLSARGQQCRRSGQS